MNKVFLTVNCQGGLGNQLFQFIVGYILAKKNNINLRINIERYNSYHHQFELDRFPEVCKLNIPKIKNDNFFFKIYLYLYHKFHKILKISGIYKLINYFFFIEIKEFEKNLEFGNDYDIESASFTKKNNDYEQENVDNKITMS